MDFRLVFLKLAWCHAVLGLEILGEMAAIGETDRDADFADLEKACRVGQHRGRSFQAKIVKPRPGRNTSVLILK